MSKEKREKFLSREPDVVDYVIIWKTLIYNVHTNHFEGFYCVGKTHFSRHDCFFIP
jgi:hypothetical protein